MSMNDVKTAEEWAAEKKIEGWKFAAAKAGNAWPVGKELSEEDFDDAVEASITHRIG
jgi:hypothetical protein